MKAKLTILLAAICALVSCKTVNRLQENATELFRGEIVAKVGNHRLHLSQLQKYIPSGVSAEDSAAFARQYIMGWAQDILMLDMAEEQLSSEEKDVTADLEEYRRNLLKYRYEQLYISQRLDTLVTDEEIAGYYERNAGRFRLERPVYKARYVIIPADARSLKAIREKMSSEDPLEVMEADSLASTVAIKYADQSDTWMDGMVLAGEAGVEYRLMTEGFRKQFAEITDEAGNMHVIYAVETVAAGNTAPIEYCSEHIKDLILSERKHNLEENLSKSLLEDAAKNNKFVIY